jgi:hypothetical protein
MKTELITEAPDAAKPQLAIAVRIFDNRRSKHAKGDGSRSRERLGSKVTHVSWTRMIQKRVRHSKPPEFKPVRIEAEVLAEFEGPTSEDAAREFVKLYQSGRTLSNGAKCLADGPVPPPPQALDGRRGDLPSHRLN